MRVKIVRPRKKWWYEELRGEELDVKPISEKVNFQDMDGVPVSNLYEVVDPSNYNGTFIVKDDVININTINESTNLKLVRDWITPYNSFNKGDYAKAEYWASKLNNHPYTFVNDFNNGKLNQWFEVKE